MLTFASCAKTNGNALEAFLALIPPGLKRGEEGFLRDQWAQKVSTSWTKAGSLRRDTLNFQRPGPRGSATGMGHTKRTAAWSQYGQGMISQALHGVAKEGGSPLGQFVKEG